MDSLRVKVDQLLFAYDEGHRLVAGSCELNPRTTSLLLGATDAAVSDQAGRLLTGLPLEVERAYALCATWSSPESPRPGAVIAHVLLINEKLITTAPDPMAFAHHLCRPTLTDWDSYRRALDVTTTTAPKHQPNGDTKLQRELFVAAFSRKSPPLLVESDLASSEAALQELWRSLWPAMRFRFAFRTREVARVRLDDEALIITRAVHGTRPRNTLQDARERAALEAACEEPEGLRQFFSAIGPLCEPRMQVAGRLALIYGLMRQQATADVLQELQAWFTDASFGREIKRRLLGAEQRWASEPDLLGALLRASGGIFDLDDLGVAQRVRALASQAGLQSTVAVLSELSSPERAFETVAPWISLDEYANIFGLLGGARSRTLSKLPAARDPEAWQSLPAEQARSILHDCKSKPILRAAGRGNGDALLQAVQPIAALRILDSVGNLDAIRRSSEQVNLGSFWTVTEAEDSIRLAATATRIPVSALPSLLQAMEARREVADPIWLMAAVSLLVQHAEMTGVLEVVFGPLHRAMTSDALPRACWRDLDPVLPKADDPSLRLRRLLIAVSRRQHWSSRQMERALRDAGPFTGELLHEFEHQDEWYIAVMKKALRSVGFH
jgi:hypothetical protein